MIVDVSTNVISLSPVPEDYKVRYYIEQHELHNSSFYAALLNSLLTFEIASDGAWTTSIVDFFILNSIISKFNYQIPLNITELGMKVCKHYVEQRLEAINIKQGGMNSKIITTLKNQPFEDQKPAIAFMLARCLAGNFSSVGIGKTMSALGAFNILKNQNKVSNGLVFCLNENKLTWRNELIKHTNYKFTIVGNGTQNVIRDIDTFNGDLLVVHYDCLLNDDVKNSLMKHGFDFWVCDEAHILRNFGKKKLNKVSNTYEPVCQRANAVFDLQAAMKPHFVFPLTGTPIPENPVNAYSILKLLCPKLIPGRTRFEEHFCNFISIPIKKGSKRKIKILNKKDPFKNLDQLALLMELYSFRVTQDDVKGFPPTIISIRELELESDQRILHDSIEAQTLGNRADPELMKNIKNVMVRTLRLRQALSHPILVGDAKTSSIKFKYLDSILDEILEDPKQKVVLFSCFRPTLELLKDRYKDQYGAVLFAGVGSSPGIEKLTNEQRNLNIELFLSDPYTRILCANSCLGAGGNWGQVARYGIFVDLPEERMDLAQSIGRITRRDALGTSNIIFLLGANTVDIRILALLQGKTEVIDSLLGKDQEITININEILKEINP